MKAAHREHVEIPAVDGYATITLSRCGSVFAKVDHEVLDVLSRFTWSKHECGKGKIYARAQRCPETGGLLLLYMHHIVADFFGIKPAHPSHTHLDHRGGDGLDNRRHKLIWRHPVHNRWGTARWGDACAPGF